MTKDVFMEFELAFSLDFPPVILISNLLCTFDFEQ